MQPQYAPATPAVIPTDFLDYLEYRVATALGVTSDMLTVVEFIAEGKKQLQYNEPVMLTVSGNQAAMQLADGSIVTLGAAPANHLENSNLPQA